MTTAMAFLEDTYLFQTQATITVCSRDEKGVYYSFDTTVFYPHGGGQPSDIGQIIAENVNLSVTDVRFFPEGIRHYVAENTIDLPIGIQVALEIDVDRRILNSKAHTAGHLVQALIDDSHIGLKAVKGYHYPDGPYVIFEGPMPSDPEGLITSLNHQLAAKIAVGEIIDVRMVDKVELLRLCPHLPYEVPENKPLRVVKIGAIGNFVPCGGTHLRNINELASISVSKIKAKKGEIKVSYSYQ